MPCQQQQQQLQRPTIKLSIGARTIDARTPRTTTRIRLCPPPVGPLPAHPHCRLLRLVWTPHQPRTLRPHGILSRVSSSKNARPSPRYLGIATTKAPCRRAPRDYRAPHHPVPSQGSNGTRPGRTSMQVWRGSSSNGKSTAQADGVIHMRPYSNFESGPEREDENEDSSNWQKCIRIGRRAGVYIQCTLLSWSHREQPRVCRWDTRIRSPSPFGHLQSCRDGGDRGVLSETRALSEMM